MSVSPRKSHRNRTRRRKNPMWSLLTCCMTFDRDSRTSQSFTSHVNYIPPNQQSQQRRVGSFRPSLTTLNTEHYPHNGQKSHPTQFNTALMFDPMLRKSRISEWGIAGVGIEPPGFPGTYLQRTKSLWNVKNEDDYWTRAPPSRPVSMGYVNRALQDNSHEVSQSRNGGLTTQVVDTGKRRMVRMGGRRAASMDGLNFNRCYNQNIMANQLTPDWSKSSLESGGEDEEYHYYGRRGEPLWSIYRFSPIDLQESKVREEYKIILFYKINSILWEASN